MKQGKVPLWVLRLISLLNFACVNATGLMAKKTMVRNKQCRGSLVLSRQMFERLHIVCFVTPLRVIAGFEDDNYMYFTL